MRCPHCRKDEFWRMASPRWMKRVPGMHNLRCATCGREIAILFGTIRMRHRRARKLSRYWLFLWLAVGFAIIGLVAVKLMYWKMGTV